jgi:hypothetical protein
MCVLGLLHLSPHAGRGRPAEASAKAGRVRGVSRNAELRQCPSSGSDLPVLATLSPLSGEKEEAVLPGLTRPPSLNRPRNIKPGGDLGLFGRGLWGGNNGDP